MENLKKWFRLAVPAGWADNVVRAMKVAVVAFAVRQLQDWLESGAFDTLPNAMDAVLIAAGVFALNAILILVWAKKGD